LNEADVARAIIAHSKHVILAADSSKFSRSAPMLFGHLSQVNTLVTDTCRSDAIRALCTEHEIELVEALG